MDDALEERVQALERTVTDSEQDLSQLTDESQALERLEALERQVTELTDRVAELEAATQALRGYVGNIRSVNQDVEKRADAALAKAESLETRVNDGKVPSSQSREQKLVGTAKAGQPSADGKTAKAGQPSADGGTVIEEKTATNHCQACGQTADKPHSQELADQPENANETLVPETTETGTLQRIRKLL